MKITFACPQCARPLVADSSQAGRTGRCRHCGNRAIVPSGPGESGLSRHSASGNAASENASPDSGRPAGDWRAAVASQLPSPTGRGAPPGSRQAASTRPAAAQPSADTTGGYTLRPVTPVRVPALAASDWDNAELGPPVASPPSVFTSSAQISRKESRVVPRAAATAPTSTNGVSPLVNLLTLVTNLLGIRPALSTTSGASPTLVAYRTFFGLLGRVTAWISETSYTISFILIILAVASGMIGRHTFAAMACGAIVALNLIGLSGDIASLVTLSFRKNPLQGGLFLVPPFTLYYLWTDWQRYRDTVVRMRIPLVTLALVVAAYMFVPWLRGGIKAEVPVVASVEKAVDTVEKELAGRQGAFFEEGLKKARTWLHEVPMPDPSSLPGSHSPQKTAPGPKP